MNVISKTTMFGHAGAVSRSIRAMMRTGGVCAALAERRRPPPLKLS